MVLIDSFAVGLVSLLASTAIARPYARIQDESEPMPLKSRITAFINTDNGLHVECWEIGDILPDRRGAPRGLRMSDSLEAFDIMTWPSHGIIYSPDKGSRSGSIGEKPTINKVERGMVRARCSNPSMRQASEEHWHFGPDNGDDWFYFEDSSRGNSRRVSSVTGACPNPRAAASSGPRLEALSNAETSLMSLVYGDTPPHKKIHDGRCSMNGLKPVDASHGKDQDEAAFLTQYSGRQ